MTMFGKSRSWDDQRPSSQHRTHVDLERVEHALAGDDDLLGLLLDGQGPDQRRHLLGRLPLGELTETLLAGPDGRVDDLEEELTGARVEDEDGAVDGLGGQIALERLVDGDAVDVGVVDEPDDLVAEELRVVLRVEVRLGRLGRVELQALADALAQDVQGRVGLHDLGHGLLDERLEAWEVVAVGRVQVVREVDGDQQAGRRRVDWAVSSIYSPGRTHSTCCPCCSRGTWRGHSAQCRASQSRPTEAGCRPRTCCSSRPRGRPWSR